MDVRLNVEQHVSKRVMENIFTLVKVHLTNLWDSSHLITRIKPAVWIWAQIIYSTGHVRIGFLSVFGTTAPWGLAFKPAFLGLFFHPNQMCLSVEKEELEAFQPPSVKPSTQESLIMSLILVITTVPSSFTAPLFPRSSPQLLHCPCWTWEGSLSHLTLSVWHVLSCTTSLPPWPGWTSFTKKGPCSVDSVS